MLCSQPLWVMDEPSTVSEIKHIKSYVEKKFKAQKSLCSSENKVILDLLSYTESISICHDSSHMAKNED